MASIQAPGAQERHFQIPKPATGGLHLLDRLSAFESPIVQIAVIVLAAALASVVGGAIIRMLADGLSQS